MRRNTREEPKQVLVQLHLRMVNDVQHWLGLHRALALAQPRECSSCARWPGLYGGGESQDYLWLWKCTLNGCVHACLPFGKCNNRNQAGSLAMQTNPAFQDIHINLCTWVIQLFKGQDSLVRALPCRCHSSGC